ncbi:MAG: hypothetical protein ACI83E_003136, partial [Sulfitobacter sp.]
MLCLFCGQGVISARLSEKAAQSIVNHEIFVTLST